MSRWRLPFIAAILAALTFVVFMRVLSAEFVKWDDDLQLYHNAEMGGLTWNRIVWAMTDVKTAARYIPLTLVGYLVTYEFCGMRPFGYHLGNLLLHCGSVALAFLLVRQLLLAATSKSALRSINETWLTLCASIGALLWGWHPLRVEPVAWATDRTYCQAMFFLMIALLLYVHFMRGQAAGRRRTGLYVCSLVAYMLSLLSHPFGLMLPAVLLIIDAYPFRQVRIGRGMFRDASLRCIVQKVPFACVALAVLGLGLWARFAQSKVFETPVTLEQFSVMSRLSQAFYLLGYYAWRPWWPVDLTPVRTELVRFTATQPRFFLSIFGVLAVTMLLIVMHRRWPAALALWAFHLVALIPVLGWTEHPHYPSDRYSLWEGLAWPIGAAAILWQLGSAPRIQRRALVAAASVAIVTVIGLAALSVRQTAVWHDSLKLFDHMIRVLGNNPYRSDIYTRKGMYYQDNDNPDPAEAERAFKTALEVNQRNSFARMRLAAHLGMYKRWNEVIPLMKEGLLLHSDFRDFHFMLGVALASTGRFQEAEDQIAQVLAMNPNDVAAQQALADMQRARQQSTGER